ncbi:T9SS type A sorting domain-containing protein [Hymenobacter aerilatus]|uniref:T9SS type A sorting domain-containing protein n=1 Tax=Hymenobacter aerilatus TaxID=2932251 RepID=A0A8T9SWI4_9BACT|nr:T9SS type A sorting domain-containing protein [Hymenobacter aerilatus]UOR06438.1 T9SS type A sorting domain-containing protein [Hymenobacter aerilatus]
MKHFFSLLLGLSPLMSLAQTLTTTGGAVVTVQGGATLYVAGGVQQASGSTLTNAGTLQLTGDFTNAGTLTSPGTLLFSGSQDQTFAPGSATVAYLTLRNTGAAGSNRLFIPANLTITSLLTLTQGLVRTQGVGGGAPLYTLRLPNEASVVGEEAGRYVQGRLQVTRTAGVGAMDFANGLVLNANGQNLGTVTVTRTAGLQLAGVSYGQNGSGTSKGIDRVWEVTADQPLNPATPASVTVSWVADDDHGLTMPTTAQLWRADQTTGPWAPQGAPVGVSARSFTASVAQLGVLTLSNTNQPLPVELVRFTAERRGTAALLRWSTVSEVNNDRFEVEVSEDGYAFRRIGQVSGHGTSSLPHEYQLLDPTLAQYGAAQVYYRLRQVDHDGTAHFSPVRTVVVSGQPELALFPNPTSQATTLTGALPGAVVSVYDATGRLVHSGTVDAAGSAQLRLPAGSATGVYLVRTGPHALRLIVQ